MVIFSFVAVLRGGGDCHRAQTVAKRNATINGFTAANTPPHGYRFGERRVYDCGFNALFWLKVHRARFAMR
ncbi:hypothetical protein DNO_0599 [Dichelobacter nodosus VCS1703A]|uniref:Uncharacterized protein n=1 Tax=Dichelobacter nodosus (strain VCS1703A) TaxID=246195 RepID=A5EVE0_DICNV|nr:hypothetical protein DNO_0599 [Dichelobacter nodosus VCS1703A]